MPTPKCETIAIDYRLFLDALDDVFDNEIDYHQSEYHHDSNAKFMAVLINQVLLSVSDIAQQC